MTDTTPTTAPASHGNLTDASNSATVITANGKTALPPQSPESVNEAALEASNNVSLADLADIDVAKGIEQEIEQVSAVYQMIIEFFVNYSFQLVGAVIVFLLGLFVARKISNLAEKLCLQKDLDVTLAGFIGSAIRLLIIVMVAIIALGKLGISVTPFLAAIGALSLGAGLALQGVLSNYGAGFNIIVTRPFVVGDTIDVQGVSGQVKSVRLAFTTLMDEEGTVITIPNKHITGEILHNSYSNTLANISIGIAYSEDTDHAIDVIRTAIDKIPELKHTPKFNDEGEEIPGSHPIQIGIDSFGDSSVNIAIRAWLPTASYHQLRFELNSTVYKALQTAGVDIPFPQREVRMLDKS